MSGLSRSLLCRKFQIILGVWWCTAFKEYKHHAASSGEKKIVIFTISGWRCASAPADAAIKKSVQKVSLKADALTSLTFWSKNYLSILKASRPLSLILDSNKTSIGINNIPFFSFLKVSKKKKQTKKLTLGSFQHLSINCQCNNHNLQLCFLKELVFFEILQNL